MKFMEQTLLADAAEYTITLDDDEIVHRIVERSIGLKSLPFRSADELAKSADHLHPVAAFIDIHLGDGISGLQLIPKLREKWPFCPLIIITADPSEATLSDALASGADDFVTKPIRSKELLARLQARLADQAQKEAKQSLNVGNLTFDSAHRLLIGPRGHRYLSTTETNLLMCLLQAKGTIVLREVLKLRCWGPLKVSEGALDRKIFEVRRALKEIGGTPTIRTAYGVGFGIEIQEN
jgi:DNA-binding response OmpR family regulator